jgi:EmrB/QacA subfamily drug resistance transporter
VTTQRRHDPAGTTTTASRQSPEPEPAPERPDLGTLLVLLAATFMATLDFFIVNVAIPSMQRDLHAGSAAIEFVVVGYALAYGAALITGGRLGDVYGRRRMFVWGMVLFTVSSAVCGAAPVPGVLIGGRVAQGLAAALMSPQVLTILGAMYSGEARARAFNSYGVSMGLAAVFGQLIGGVLIHDNVFGWGWRTCFLINVPIGVVALLLVPRVVPESRAPGRPRLDIGGMTVVTLALVAVVLPLIEGREQGWPLWAWLCLAAAVPLFGLFALYERRFTGRGGSPLLDLDLFRERAFTAGLVATLVFFASLASFYLVFALYVQFGRGLNALDAGLIFVPIGVGYMTTSIAARHVAARIGRQVIALGGLMRVVGLGLLILTVERIGVHGHIAWLVPALAIDGAGVGFVVAPVASTVLSRITPHHAGAASGVLTTGIQIGNAIGVAIIGVIFYGLLDPAGGAGSYAHAFDYSLVYLIAVGVFLAVVVQALPRKPRGR